MVRLHLLLFEKYLYQKQVSTAIHTTEFHVRAKDFPTLFL